LARPSSTPGRRRKREVNDCRTTPVPTTNTPTPPPPLPPRARRGVCFFFCQYPPPSGIETLAEGAMLFVKSTRAPRTCDHWRCSHGDCPRQLEHSWASGNGDRPPVKRSRPGEGFPWLTSLSSPGPMTHLEGRQVDSGLHRHPAHDRSSRAGADCRALDRTGTSERLAAARRARIGESVSG